GLFANCGPTSSSTHPAVPARIRRPTHASPIFEEIDFPFPDMQLTWPPSHELASARRYRTDAVLRQASTLGTGTGRSQVCSLHQGSPRGTARDPMLDSPSFAGPPRSSAAFHAGQWTTRWRFLAKMS